LNNCVIFLAGAGTHLKKATTEDEREDDFGERMR
jgi:hypothetical protein